MSERRPHSLLIDPSPALDETESGYFDVLDTSTDPTYNRLKIPKTELEQAKEAFFGSGRQTNPDLRPLHLDEQELLFNEADWLTFKDRITDSQLEPVLKQAYLWRINEEIGHERMIQAAAAGDMLAFEAYNRFIYGEADPEITAATVDWFRQDAKQFTDHENPTVRIAAEQVLQCLPDLNGDYRELMPDPDVFERVRELHFRENGYFALLFAGIEIPDIPKIDTATGDPILWQALRNLESNHVVADAPAKAWAADHIKGELQRPASYNMPIRRFLGLPGHEFKHILERNNGFRQPIRLAGNGFDRYEVGNEGRAVMVEQVAFPDFESFSKQLRWQDIMRRFLASALGTGEIVKGGYAGGRLPLDFSQTFSVINSIDRLWELKKKPDDIAAAELKADNRTWDLLATKTFVGGDGSALAVYRKNRVYLPGNLACWKVAENDLQLIDDGDLAKFDISNPRHIAILQRYDILPTNNDLSA